MDAITAISLVDLSMQDSALEDTVDALHLTFPKYPDYDYLLTAKKILNRLNLYDIWKEELLYYGKLLNVDHKTLESEINKGSDYIFKKFDYVSDDNIPLTSSLITSSYFNTKDKNQDHINKDFKDEKKVVNDRLAATLKKHANLNKEELQPGTSDTKTAKKRKRKEVTVDSTEITEKLKRDDKKKTKTKRQSETTLGDLNVNQNVINAIPSVNDIFGDLEINLDFENVNNKLCSSEKSKLINTEDLKKVSSSNFKNSVSVKDKLKQFKFSENHSSKLLEEKINNQDETVESKVISCINKSCSQRTLFETSDCDSDLDI